MSRFHLLATDGSDASEQAIEYARDKLTAEKDELIVLSVADESKVVPYMMEEESTIGGVDFELIRESIEQRAEDALEDAQEILVDAEFTVQTMQEFGDPGTIICEVAEEENVDSIIIGRRGHTTVGELLLGSVSHYVVHHTERPVTLVPYSSDEE